MKVKAQSAHRACIILAAGKGTRMRSRLPKVMHQVAGKPMLMHVIDTAQNIARKIVVVTSPDMEKLRGIIKEQYKGTVENAVQQEQRGTGDAVKAAKPALKNFTGTVFVLYGDTPLILPTTLERMEKLIAKDAKQAIAVLGMRVDGPNEYGRLVIDKKGDLERIVEAKDANATEQKIEWCNSGVMAVKGKILFSLLDKITAKNAKKEYYLTDLVALARKAGYRCGVVKSDDMTELAGVNSRLDLCNVESFMQWRLREHAMESGVTLIDPATVYFSADTKLGQDVVIHPNVVFGPGVTVGDNVEIRSFSHIEKAKIKNGASVGPFARLRPGAIIGEKAHIGNFVEIKQTTVEAGAKINHLSYIGDAHIGENANIGAGTITCNYDGYNKHRTIVGASAFVGSNTSLVAPVVIGDGAMIGAGSVITEDVDADALAVARAPQKQKTHWAKTFRNRKNN